MKKLSADDLPTTPAHNGVSRKALVKVGEMKSCVQTVNIAWLEPGKGFEPHKHDDGEEIYYFLSGVGEMVIDDETCTVKKGDCVIVEQSESHGLKNTSQASLRFLTIRSTI